MAGIFICYRRDDTAGVAGRIYDRLVSKFGKQAVFYDVNSIPYGDDFRRQSKDSISQCKVMLILVGDPWLETQDGKRRLDNPDDHVRFEIATALAEGIKIIPVLIGRTTMPTEGDLPKELGKLSFHNAAPVDTGQDLDTHMQKLVKAIEGSDLKQDKTRGRASWFLVVVLMVVVALWLLDIPHGKLIAGYLLVAALMIFLGGYFYPVIRGIIGRSFFFKSKGSVSMQSGKKGLTASDLRLAEIIPNFLTATRPAFGIAAAIVMVRGDFTLGFWLFFCGQVTDLLDGMFARALKGTTHRGKDFDAITDMLLHLVVGAALVWVTMFPNFLLGRFLAVALIGPMFLARHLFFPNKPRKQVLHKYLSGYTRLMLIIVAWSLVPVSDRLTTGLAGLAFLVLGGCYEWIVAKEAVQAGDFLELKDARSQAAKPGSAP